MMNEDQFAAVHAMLGTQGGFTVNPRTGQQITSGISVAPRGNERKIPISESHPLQLQQFAHENTHRWTNEVDEAGKVVRPHNASLGGWRSEDTDYLDTPTVYPNTGSGEKGARKNMVWSGQEAGFNLDSFQEIMNPFHPETRRKMGMEPHELAPGTERARPEGLPPDAVYKGTIRTGRDLAEWQMQQPEVQAWVNSPVAGRAARDRLDQRRGKGKPR